MRKFMTLLACLIVCLPLSVKAGIDADGLPSTSTWYLHADFVAMRKSNAGSALYNWIDREIFEEIRSEAGIDLRKELDSVTTYSAPADGAVMVMEGRISDTTRDKLLAISAGAERFETLQSKGKTYYFVEGDEGFKTDNVEVDGFDGEIYFSFDVKNKLILAANKKQIEILLANGGKLAGAKEHNGALIILTAEQSLIQAGMDTDGFKTEEGGFESNILRNTKQVALMIADAADKLSIEAMLVATEPKTAQSLASIIRGIVALVAFDEDMDPDMAEVLQSAKIDVNNAALKVSVSMSPESFNAALD